MRLNLVDHGLCHFGLDPNGAISRGRPERERSDTRLVLSRRGDRESTVHDDMARPSMAAYDMPLDGEEEIKKDK